MLRTCLRREKKSNEKGFDSQIRGHSVSPIIVGAKTCNNWEPNPNSFTFHPSVNCQAHGVQNQPCTIQHPVQRLHYYEPAKRTPTPCKLKNPKTTVYKMVRPEGKTHVSGHAVRANGWNPMADGASRRNRTQTDRDRVKREDE